jgi:hypothetical protein
MPFLRSVPLSRLISLFRRKILAKRIRLLCLVIFFAVVLSNLPAYLERNGAKAQSSDWRQTQRPQIVT